MNLKCFSCRTEMFEPGDRVTSRHNDKGDTIFDCPLCKAENCARTILVDDDKRYAIYRIKTSREDIFFGPCENPDCIGHGVVVEPPALTSVTDTSCPDCGYTRMIAKNNI